jgi:hypothetical protein
VCTIGSKPPLPKIRAIAFMAARAIEHFLDSRDEAKPPPSAPIPGMPYAVQRPPRTVTAPATGMAKPAVNIDLRFKEETNTTRVLDLIRNAIDQHGQVEDLYGAPKRMVLRNIVRDAFFSTRGDNTKSNTVVFSRLIGDLCNQRIIDVLGSPGKRDARLFLIADEPQPANAVD